MQAEVFFLPVDDHEPDHEICGRLEKFLLGQKLFFYVAPRDLVAVKTHFGEEAAGGIIRPPYLAMFGRLLKERGGLPFLTDTQTLYSGRRTNAVTHVELANDHGFGYEKTGLPIIMADGLLGEDEIELPIPGRIYSKVNIASLIVKSQSLLLASHFTGHLVTGFGAALKNLGMGCASRRGKLQQHSTSKPSIRVKKCTGCAECQRWCPVEAISLQQGIAVINRKACIGCAECLAVCRFDAVGYNWSMPQVEVQKRMVEHALAVVQNKKNKLLAVNFLTRISRDCDCIKGHQRIMPDIGVLVSRDPLALDWASLDLVEERAGRPLGQLAHDLPCRVQLEYAAELGLGSASYRLVEI